MGMGIVMGVMGGFWREGVECCTITILKTIPPPTLYVDFLKTRRPRSNTHAAVERCTIFH